MNGASLTHLELTILIAILAVLSSILIVTQRDTTIGETILLAIALYVLGRTIVQAANSKLQTSGTPLPVSYSTAKLAEQKATSSRAREIRFPSYLECELGEPQGSESSQLTWMR